MGTFGVARLIKYVMMNKKIKSKRNIFFIIDFLLQASLVGNILYLVMFLTKEFTTKNYLILLIASILAGIVSSFVDTTRIFSSGSKYKLPKPEPNDRLYISFYFAFILLYIGLNIVIGIKLY